jgi:hypothetical protein
MYRELGRKQSKQAKQSGGWKGKQQQQQCQQQQGQENTDKQTPTATATVRVCFCISLGQFCVIAKMAIIHRKI